MAVLVESWRELLAVGSKMRQLLRLKHNLCEKCQSNMGFHWRITRKEHTFAQAMHSNHDVRQMQGLESRRKGPMTHRVRSRGRRDLRTKSKTVRQRAGQHVVRAIPWDRRPRGITCLGLSCIMHVSYISLGCICADIFCDS